MDSKNKPVWYVSTSLMKHKGGSSQKMRITFLEFDLFDTTVFSKNSHVHIFYLFYSKNGKWKNQYLPFRFENTVFLKIKASLRIFDFIDA